jgi:hypothetical protein
MAMSTPLPMEAIRQQATRLEPVPTPSQLPSISGEIAQEGSTQDESGESAALTEPPTFPTLTAPPMMVAPPSAPASEKSITPMKVPKEPRPFKPIVQPWKTLPPPPPRARTSSRPSMNAVDPRAAALPNRLPPPGVAAKTLLAISAPPAPDTVKDLENLPLA